MVTVTVGARVRLSAHVDSVWDGATGVVSEVSPLLGHQPFYVVRLDNPGEYAFPTVIVGAQQLTVVDAR